MSRNGSWAEKLVHDLEYIAERSVGLYLRCVSATIGGLFTHSARAILAAARRD
jgi:hypothetical protein